MVCCNVYFINQFSTEETVCECTDLLTIQCSVIDLSYLLLYFTSLKYLLST